MSFIPGVSSGFQPTTLGDSVLAAEGVSRLPDMTPGQYVLEVDNLLTATKDGELSLFIAEFTIVSSTAADRRAGTQCAWRQGIGKTNKEGGKKKRELALKEFFLALLGVRSLEELLQVADKASPEFAAKFQQYVQFVNTEVFARILKTSKAQEPLVGSLLKRKIVATATFGKAINQQTGMPYINVQFAPYVAA